MDKWIITDKYVIGYNTNILTKTYNKIHFFDLDNTIIKTKSGRRFPTNNYDWELLNSNVKHKINKLEFCGIISNQSGLRTKTQIDGWIKKIKDISLEIRIDALFCSLQNSEYRKPMNGFWDYMKQNLFLNIDTTKLINDKKIYYIGDACGRENDFSDTDLKFAINCNFIFKTPEIFYGSTINEKCYVSYPELIYYTKEQYELIINNLYINIDKYINNNKSIIIMMIGFPSSGKSFIRKILLDKYNNFKYTNSDEIKNKTINDKLLDQKLLIKNKLIINDNTNMEYEKQSKILNELNDYIKIAIIFDYSIDLCNHLNYMRMYHFKFKLIGNVVYNTLNKKSPNFVDDISKNNYDYIVKIDKLLPQYNIENNLKYYY